MKENAAVLFISGQSNAHAHGQLLKESDYIVNPLKNVFSLDRDPNQSFNITDVVWSGFTTQGKNLGETQDNTYSFAYFFAKLWQNAIDCGVADLPDLYIVQVSVGSQGIINGMWNRDKEKIMIPGPLDTVDISLFPWAMQINRLVMKNLKQSGKKPIVVGWHWIGSEQELHKEAYNRGDFQERYNYFFDSMLASIGEQCPLFLYKLGCKKYCERHYLPADAVDAVNKVLQSQCERHENVTLIDIEKCPMWDVLQEHNGVYAADDAHYLADTQKWFAEEFFANVIKSNILEKEIEKMKSIKDKYLLVGADFAGYPLKEAVVAHLKEKGWKITDVGVTAESDPDDTENMFHRVGLRVGSMISEGEFERALIFCGTGMGIHIAASKCPHVHAGVVESVPAALRAITGNGVNVLAMGAFYVAPQMGCDIADAYLNASLGSGYEWWYNFYEFHKLAIDELEAFDYETYKKNGFKMEHLGDYPLKLETKPEGV